MKGQLTSPQVLCSLSEKLAQGDADKVMELTRSALAMGINPLTLLNDGLIKGMSIVGTKFKNKELPITEVLMASRAMHAGLYILKPLLSECNILPRETIVVGTVAGDLHDIGKSLVVAFLQGAGFHVIDIGIDVPPEDFVEAVKEYRPRVLGLSALLTTTLPAIGDTIRKLEEEGVRQNILIIVGGGPVTKSFARSVGADLYAPDACSAVEKIVSALDG